MQQTQRFLQGDLQALFDALFFMGAIDPMLKSDWQSIQTELEVSRPLLETTLKAVNGCGGSPAQLIGMLKELDPKAIQFLTMEVARELAEFADRQSLH